MKEKEFKLSHLLPSLPHFKKNINMILGCIWKLKIDIRRRKEIIRLLLKEKKNS